MSNDTDSDSRLAGYLHPSYVASLAAFGEPVCLPRSGGWLLKRRIPNTDLYDAMGPYPLFCCQDWSGLAQDLSDLEGQLVSVAVVVDPLGGWTPELLAGSFTLARPFKEHRLVDLSEPPEQVITRHHRVYTRKALDGASVVVAECPAAHLDEWCSLYGVLVRRHGLQGMLAFSRGSFEQQLQVPGSVMVRLVRDGECTASIVWYLQGGVAYAHLLGISEGGYSQWASYGLFGGSIRLFAERHWPAVRLLDIGAEAGAAGHTTSGLGWFKSGWSNAAKHAWFCGRILDPSGYEGLARGLAQSTSGYFPAYRAGEFG